MKKETNSDDKVYDVIIGQLGIHDFFNVLFAGGVFWGGILCLYSEFWEKYMEASVSKQAFVFMLVLVYFSGLFVQELGSIFDESCLKLRKRVIKTFTWEEKKYRKYLRKNWIYKFCEMMDKKHKKLFKNPTVMNCEHKLQVCRQNGKEILAMHDIDFDDDFTEEQNKYIYSYCCYYIETLGIHKKYEKMRALYDMSRTILTCAIMFLILCAGDLILELGWISSRFFEAKIGILVILSGVFYYRTEKLSKYMARMLMSLYDVSKPINHTNKGARE